ncbi:MAG: UDP-N-acetylmuramoyl-tripeptide--D-alanyl-D-alanine ligase, partial [Hyphomicrobium sp.]
FVALKDQRDGHEFVSSAFAKGASVAIVSQGYLRKDCDGPLIRVKDTLVSLEKIGRAARARLSPMARVVAVTGSVGKTTTKEMLSLTLTSLGKTHASTKSYNNLWGVPLSLARMPKDTHYAIFEIGMNHAGEITPLTKMVQPHVAIITTVEAVHLENFRSVSEIADAKAEIFRGLAENGSAIINLDNPHWARLYRWAKEYKANIIGVTKELMATEAVRSFAVQRAISLTSVKMESAKSLLKVEKSSDNGEVQFVLGAPGTHLVTNALFVVAALNEMGADLERGIQALEFFTPPQGRGTRTQLKLDAGSFLLIDESYNTNPASMRADFQYCPQSQDRTIPDVL